MSGRLLRFICTTALATVVVGATPALAVPVGLGSPVPEPGPAASPAPTGPATPATPATPAAPGAADGRTGATGTGSPAAPGDAAADPGLGEPGLSGPGVTDPAPGAPGVAPAAPRTPAEATLTRLRTLYQQSEQAGQTYRATTEALKRQQAKANSVGAGLVKARMELAQSRNAAGRLAREQYQEQSGLSPYISLMLGGDPQQALDAGHQIQRASADLMAKARRSRRPRRMPGNSTPRHVPHCRRSRHSSPGRSSSTRRPRPVCARRKHCSPGSPPAKRPTYRRRTTPIRPPPRARWTPPGR